MAQFVTMIGRVSIEALLIVSLAVVSALAQFGGGRLPAPPSPRRFGFAGPGSRANQNRFYSTPPITR